jgi:transcription elongation factor GreA
MSKEPITESGLIDLEKKLHFLKNVQLLKIIKDIKKAREFGDLKENSEYHAAKEDLYMLKKKIKKIEEHILNSDVIYMKTIKDVTTVIFGARVKFQNLENLCILNYKIVGEYESDINLNKISIKSPLAKAMILKKKNDIFDVKVFDKLTKYKILDIEYI